MQTEMTPSMPEPLRPTMTARIEAVADLFPGWVNRLVIDYSRSIEDSVTADVQYEYRAMSLTVHPAFFEESDWEHTLIHEIGHALLKPMVAFGDRLIETFVGDEAMRRFLLDAYAYAEEETAEDLAIFIGKLQNRKTASARSGADETRPSDGQGSARRGEQAARDA